MLVNLNDVLIDAQRNKYGVGLFNAVNLEMALGVLSAAEKLRSPVIVGTAEVLLPFAPLENVADMLIPMAKRAGIPVVVHYDHGLTFEKCMEALKLGFSSIMYDCSTDEYDENIKKVAELVKIAHCFGATVEAELGHVGNNEGDGSPESFYTDPRQAADFVSKTSVDALAIAVGTAHGAYKLPPKLDFERIEKIASIIPTPLVLHGGSGLADDDFRKAIACGICKINIFTDINVAGAVAVKNALISGKTSTTDVMNVAVDAVKAETEKKMKLFMSDGRA